VLFTLSVVSVLDSEPSACARDAGSPAGSRPRRPGRTGRSGQRDASALSRWSATRYEVGRVLTTGESYTRPEPPQGRHQTPENQLNGQFRVSMAVRQCIDARRQTPAACGPRTPFRLASNLMRAKSVRRSKATHARGVLEARVGQGRNHPAARQLPDDHPRLLCSLHVGGWKQGPDGNRRTAGEAGRSACHSKLPRFSPGLRPDNFHSSALSASAVDCKTEERGGLRKC